MKKTVLLTGATGFLGSHLLEALISKGHKVIILKRSFSDTWRIHRFLSHVVTYDVDLSPLPEIFQTNKIDCIMHLATHYKKHHTYTDIHPMLQTNLTLGIKLFDLAVQHRIESFVNASTFFVYEPNESPLNEQSKTKPLNLYAENKLNFESFLEHFSTQHNLKSTTLRIFSPYGPKDRPQKLIPTIIKGAILGGPINLNDRSQRLDLIYCKDIVNGFIAAMEAAEKRKTGHEIFNIGTGHSHSIEEIVAEIEKLTNTPLKVKWALPKGDASFPAVADISKTRECLEWEPIYSLNCGLKETIEYYQGVLSNEY
jgi:nucleoside-diphosphate-sugar epimerase